MTASSTEQDTARPRSRILLADDHDLFLEGLASLLSESYDVVGLASNGQSLIEMAHALRPEVILTDISMPDFSGLSAVKKLQSADVEAKVIVLTMHAEPEVAVEAFRIGVHGYLLKQSAAKEVVAAIEEVVQGRVYLTPRIASGVISAMLGQAATPKGTEGSPEIQLSPRQREVLKLVAQGKTMKEIGNILNISSRTVEAHKYEMMQSLGATTTAQLIQFAFKFGVVAED